MDQYIKNFTALNYDRSNKIAVTTRTSGERIELLVRPITAVIYNCKIFIKLYLGGLMVNLQANEIKPED